MMHIQEGGRGRFQFAEHAGRYEHPIANPGHFEEHLGFTGALEHRATQRTDHALASATLRRMGLIAR